MLILLIVSLYVRRDFSTFNGLLELLTGNRQAYAAI